MQAVTEPFEKAVKRQKTLAVEADSLIDDIIGNLTSCLNSNDPGANVKLLESAKKSASKLTEAAKDFQGALGKCSKGLEKKFKTDLDTIWDPKGLEGKETIMYRILLRHFIREGRFDLAELFSQEAGLPLEEKLSQQFMEMFHISKALRENDADLAIAWATKHSKDLSSTGSSFEFKLHRFKYLGLVRKQNIKGALEYAQTHFYHFTGKHMKEIQQLMCCILFAKRGLEKSPYPQFADPYLAASLQVQFSREFSYLLGESFESPLYTCVSVGSTALPLIMKLSALMKDKSLEWTQANELPVTLPLLENQRYHSIFICPVTKEQGTEANPPMMLICGHVLSKESLQRLSKGSATSRFKCSYCPVDSTASQAIRIYF